jgi:hypothetical protein
MGSPIMFQFSRAIYRELARDIQAPPGCASKGHEEVLKACERNLERLATDRHYFAKPARTLFSDIRPYFPMAAQAKVLHVVQTYVAAAEEWLLKQPRHGYDANGNPLQCRATTRRGTACQREPLAHNGYCPSHQHLAETEESEVAIAA